MHRSGLLSGPATGATWEGVHQAVTREPGDLPAHRSLLPWSRGWSWHGNPPSERRPVRLGPHRCVV